MFVCLCALWTVMSKRYAGSVRLCRESNEMGYCAFLIEIRFEDAERLSERYESKSR